MTGPRKNTDVFDDDPSTSREAAQALRIRPPVRGLFAVAMLGLALIAVVTWRWGTAHYRFSDAVAFDAKLGRLRAELLQMSDLSANIVKAASASGDPRWKSVWDKVQIREHRLTHEMISYANRLSLAGATEAFVEAHRARDAFDQRSLTAIRDVGMWVTASPTWQSDYSQRVDAANAAVQRLLKLMSAESASAVQEAGATVDLYQRATATTLIVLAAAWVLMFLYTSRLQRRHSEACEAVEQLCADQDTKIGERTAALTKTNLRLDRQVSESERLGRELRLLLDNAGEGIYGLDSEGRVTFVNPAGAATLGYTPEELLGTNMHEMIHHSRENGSRFPREECVSLKAFSDGRRHREINDILWRKDGTWFPAETIITPILKDGVLSGGVVIFTDLTEQRRLVAQLMQAQKLESVGQLAAGIAHEINTPTQYIGDNVRFFADAFADIASMQQAYSRLRGAAEGRVESAVLTEIDAQVEAADWNYLAAEVPSAIEQAEDGVKRVARIVAAMKEFSHPGDSRHEMTDLNHVVETTVTVARNEWKYVAEMDLQLASDLPLVPCVSGEVGQVVLNLVVNATHAIGEVKARGDGSMGRITVATALSGENAEIRISDTGPGIPADVRHRIFDPFFTTKGVGKGTGQGLAIARSVVENKHGGSIEFADNDGGGTTFTVRLPLRQIEKQVAES